MRQHCKRNKVSECVSEQRRKRDAHGDNVPCILNLADVALERVVPLDGIVSACEVFLVNDFKADILERLAAGIDVPHLGNTVADFDSVSNLLVVRVRGVPGVGHAPFVNAKLNVASVRTALGSKDAKEKARVRVHRA